MSNKFETDFDIEKLSYDESNEDPDLNKYEMVINNSENFKAVKNHYLHGPESEREDALKSMIHFTDLFQEEAKLKVNKEVKDAEYPIDDELIPAELNEGEVRSMDHKMRELINFLIDKERFQEARALIEKTIRKSSYEGRVKKLRGILEAKGLDYNNLNEEGKEMSEVKEITPAMELEYVKDAISKKEWGEASHCLSEFAVKVKSAAKEESFAVTLQEINMSLESVDIPEKEKKSIDFYLQQAEEGVK